MSPTTIRLCVRCGVIGPHSGTGRICRDCLRQSKIDSNARHRADKARSEAITQARREAEEATRLQRREERFRIARLAQTQAAEKRREKLQKQREKDEERARLELVAQQVEQAQQEAARQAREALQRIKKNALAAKRREEERARLKVCLVELPDWCAKHPWPPAEDRVRDARDIARMLRAIAFYPV